MSWPAVLGCLLVSSFICYQYGKYVGMAVMFNQFLILEKNGILRDTINKIIEKQRNDAAK